MKLTIKFVVTEISSNGYSEITLADVNKTIKVDPTKLVSTAQDQTERVLQDLILDLRPIQKARIEAAAKEKSE